MKIMGAIGDQRRHVCEDAKMHRRCNVLTQRGNQIRKCSAYGNTQCRDERRLGDFDKNIQCNQLVIHHLAQQRLSVPVRRLGQRRFTSLHLARSKPRHIGAEHSPSRARNHLSERRILQGGPAFQSLGQTDAVGVSMGMAI